MVNCVFSSRHYVSIICGMVINCSELGQGATSMSGECFFYGVYRWWWWWWWTVCVVFFSFCEVFCDYGGVFMSCLLSISC